MPHSNVPSGLSFLFPHESKKEKRDKQLKESARIKKARKGKMPDPFATPAYKRPLQEYKTEGQKRRDSLAAKQASPAPSIEAAKNVRVPATSRKRKGDISYSVTEDLGNVAKIYADKVSKTIATVDTFGKTVKKIKDVLPNVSLPTTSTIGAGKAATTEKSGRLKDVHGRDPIKSSVQKKVEDISKPLTSGTGDLGKKISEWVGSFKFGEDAYGKAGSAERKEYHKMLAGGGTSTTEKKTARLLANREPQERSDIPKGDFPSPPLQSGRPTLEQWNKATHAPAGDAPGPLNKSGGTKKTREPGERSMPRSGIFPPSQVRDIGHAPQERGEMATTKKARAYKEHATKRVAQPDMQAGMISQALSNVFGVKVTPGVYKDDPGSKTGTRVEYAEHEKHDPSKSPAQALAERKKRKKAGMALTAFPR
jgi:hypothetical protein